MPLPGWVDWTNTGIGVGGLLLTLGALWQAKSAKEAAQSAEKSIQSHHAETDFSALVRMVKELRSYVDNGQLSEAKVRMTDLRLDLSIALERHKGTLRSKWKQLQEQQFALKLAADGLNRITDSLSNEQRGRLLEPIDAIMEVLAGQYGALGSLVEKEVFRG